MPLTRQDRINLRKKRDGIGTGEGTIDNLTSGIPEFRTEVDYETGEYKTVQYIKNGLDVVKSEFKNVNAVESAYTANWYLSDEVSLGTSHGVSDGDSTQCFKIPAESYVIDIRVIVTTLISGAGSGSMDVNVGDGTNTDMFIDAWTGEGGSLGLNTILAFGRASSATEVGQKTGRYYTDADTLDVLVTDAPTAGKIRLLVFLLQQPLDGSVYRLTKGI